MMTLEDFAKMLGASERRIRSLPKGHPERNAVAAHIRAERRVDSIYADMPFAQVSGADRTPERDTFVFGHITPNGVIHIEREFVVTPGTGTPAEQ